jgi:bile acid:Na+ symporter, BASS family
MKFLNRISSRYFSLILIFSCALAFIIPKPDPDISWIILLCLFIIIFVSFFKFDFSLAALKPELRTASVYILFRFLLLPLAIFAFIVFLSPFYAFVLFFLLLMPAAVSSPAFTTLFGARINLSMLILVISSFFSILTISILSPLVYKGDAQIGMGRFLFTLLISILLPFLLHLPLRKFRMFTTVMKDNLPLVTVLALSTIFAIAISRNRDAILENPVVIAEYLLVSFFAYAFMYFAGWVLGFRNSLEHKLTFAVSSGMNNIGLAVSLATLYLPADICIFLITAEFAWVGLLLPLRIMWKKMPDQILHPVQPTKNNAPRSS